jgi:hypothetical protein
MDSSLVHYPMGIMETVLYGGDLVDMSDSHLSYYTIRYSLDNVQLRGLLDQVTLS